MIRNVFIDLDDTLWDTFANNRRSLEMLYKEYHWSEYVPTFDQFFEVYYPIMNYFGMTTAMIVSPKNNFLICALQGLFSILVCLLQRSQLLLSMGIF